MRPFKALICGGALVFSGGVSRAAPVSVVTFVAGSEPVLTLKQPSPIVYDRDGNKLFVATDAFISDLSGPEPLVRAWNPGKSLVRISPRGAFEAWLGCESVAPSEIACSELELALGLDNDLRVARKKSTAGARGVTKELLQESTEALPPCPGDPRCPKL